VLVKLVVSLKLTHCKTGETGSFFADQHYEAALQNMDAVLELNDTRSIIYLLLMALYCLRGPKDPAAWTLAGLAVRNCIKLGLHRNPLLERSQWRENLMFGFSDLVIT
jgi:hypothetical protein